MPGWKELEKILDGNMGMGFVPPSLPATRSVRIRDNGDWRVIDMGEINNNGLFESMRTNKKFEIPEKPPEITYEKLRKQVFWDLLTTPLALGIELIGITGLLAGLAFSSPLVVLGSVAVAGGGLMLSLHKIAKFPEYVDKALDKIKADKKKFQMYRLEYLQLQLTQNDRRLNRKLVPSDGVLILQPEGQSLVKEVAAEVGKLINSYDKFTSQVYRGKISGSEDDLIAGANVVVDQTIGFVVRFLNTKDKKDGRTIANEIKNTVDRFAALVKPEEDVIKVESKVLNKTFEQLEDKIDFDRRVEERMKEMGLYEEKGKECD